MGTGGVSLFFKGSEKDRQRALFDTLDVDGSGNLDRDGLRQFVEPLVNIMIPEEASPIRLVLVTKVCNDIFDEIDIDCGGEISYDEVVEWMDHGNTFIDRIADIIDNFVLQVAHQEQDERLRQTRDSLWWNKCIEHSCQQEPWRCRAEIIAERRKLCSPMGE